MLEVTMASDPVREHQNQTSAAAAVTDHQDQVIGPSPISNGLKTVYFTVGQRKEVAVFEDQAPSEEIKSKIYFIIDGIREVKRRVRIPSRNGGRIRYPLPRLRHSNKASFTFHNINNKPPFSVNP